MDIQIKNVKFNDRLSEETICFTADIYVDGRKVGWAKNQGFGGSTDFGFPNDNGDLLKQVSEFLPPSKFSFQTSGIEDFIDDAVYELYNKKEADKLEKKMKRSFEKYVCYGKKVDNGYSYTQLGFKGTPKLADVVKTRQGFDALQNMVTRIIAKELGEGEVILNTNLEALGITTYVLDISSK